MREVAKIHQRHVLNFDVLKRRTVCLDLDDAGQRLEHRTQPFNLWWVRHLYANVPNQRASPDARRNASETLSRASMNSVG
jgi:hypothetical protein